MPPFRSRPRCARARRTTSRRSAAAERSFRRVAVPDADGGALLSAEHFEQYGSAAHSLTYFQRRANIPRFVLPLISELEASAGAVRAAAAARGKALCELEWRLTLNYYARFPDASAAVPSDEDEAAPFPWHTDIASNGDVTAIFTLQQPATLQFRRLAPAAGAALAGGPGGVYAMAMSEGSVLVSAGESRYDCAHRVVASEANPARRDRISLVLGCR